MGNGMREMQGTRVMFTKIPGNVLILAFRGMVEKILGNVREDSGECSRRFRGMFQVIPGSVIKDSKNCSREFLGMFKKIPRNVQEDSGESNF